MNIRAGAHMFWWLQQTVADVASPTERPLLIWLQGGPGASSTGYGNFEILGPLDLELQPRSHAWVSLSYDVSTHSTDSTCLALE